MARGVDDAEEHRLQSLGLLPLREGRQSRGERGQALRALAVLRRAPGPRQGAGEWGCSSQPKVALPRPCSLSPAGAPSSLQA